MPTLEITTMVGCPLTCTYCPQQNLKSSYGGAQKYMTTETFSRVIDKLPRHLRIDFSGMAEPWANPRCTQMLHYTLKKGFQVAIYTTLCGMTEADAETVIALIKMHSRQVQSFYLHLPDADGNMRGWKPSTEWEKVLLKFLALRDQGVIADFRMITMHGEGKPHPVLDHLNIKLKRWRGTTRAGSLDTKQIAPQGLCVQNPHHESAVICAATPFFDDNVLLPNGDVVLCCMDYGLKHVIGNLLTQDYYDLFMGSELGQLRKENMQIGFSDRSICKSCFFAMSHAIKPNSRWTRIQKQQALADKSKGGQVPAQRQEAPISLPTPIPPSPATPGAAHAARGELRARYKPPFKLHLGCNETRLPAGWLNVDTRRTAATDLVHSCKDLSPFADCEVKLVFSNAFFEHLYLSERIHLLRDVARVLVPGGVLLFTGIPDFEAVARAYLERRPGNGAPIFDLLQVYRYTHGAPEETPEWWTEQLHKTLFDMPTIKALLAEAGFTQAHIFRYAWGDEPNAVCLGFATEKPGPRALERQTIEAMLVELAPFTRMRPTTYEVLHSTY